MYPDQSLYPANSVPAVVKRINQALQRADQISHSEGEDNIDWFLPIVADAEAGFGGPLNVFELIKAMIEAGAAGVHLEDQLASEKKCGHMGGKVLVPTRTAIAHLTAGRLAADVSGVPTVIIARTDANAAALLTSDIDERDHEFLTGERTPEGFFRVRAGIDQAIARGLSYAPYADMLWFETSTPDLAEAKKFAERMHADFPGKLLAYNCSPSFNWKQSSISRRSQNFSANSARWASNSSSSRSPGSTPSTTACSNSRTAIAIGEWLLIPNCRRRSSRPKADGYSATKHQHEVGTGYFDDVARVIAGGQSSTAALRGSTEEEQFH